jgi:hypothetical protein
MDSNPLKKYFRQPAIYIRLPSQGKFYPQGTLDMPPNGELPVLPMTTLDEITYRTPDALFNGSAVISVIESCVPNIKSAWAMPSLDIDTVLVAIRIATYGHELDISTMCPACDTEADYGVDLRVVMDQISAPDYNKTITIGDLEIYFKPMTYQQMNENSMTQFQEQKMLQMLEAAETDETAKRQQLGEVLKKITEITTQALAQNIAMIRTPQAQVIDPVYIAEWLSESDRATFAKIRDYIVASKQQGELQPLSVQCGNCNHEYKQAFTLDMSNFFEVAS